MNTRQDTIVPTYTVTLDELPKEVKEAVLYMFTYGELASKPYLIFDHSFLITSKPGPYDSKHMQIIRQYCIDKDFQFAYDYHGHRLYLKFNEYTSKSYILIGETLVTVEGTSEEVKRTISKLEPLKAKITGTWEPQPMITYDDAESK